MVSEELQMGILNCCNQYIDLQKQANEDYENVKKIIEQSDKMLEKYEEKYDNVIQAKNEEIAALEDELKNLKQETDIYQKQIQNIPIEVREKYVKRRIC